MLNPEQPINPYSFLENPKTIILRLILPVIINLKCDKHVFLNILKTFWTLATVLSLNAVLDKSDGLFSYILTLSQSLLYKKITFDNKNNEEKYILTYLNKKTANQLIKHGITLEANGIKILRAKAQSILAYLKVKAQKLYQQDQRILVGKNTILLKYSLSNKLEEMKPKELFPSENYKRLGHSVDTFFKLTNKTKNFSTLPILANGIPGLGKTNFCSYIVNQKIADKVFYIEMNLFNKPYETIFELLLPKVVDCNILVMFDELDKYMDEMIRTEYSKESKKTIRKSDEPEIVLSPEDEQAKFKKFSIQFRQTFLVNLLKYMSIDCLSGSLVIMFCANNFDTLFEGIDMTHFKSLNDRLLKFKFEMCRKAEIIDYMSHYMEKCSDMDIYMEKDKYLSLLNQHLNNDVKITYRQLFYICIQNAYQAVTTARDINQWYLNFLTEDPTTVTKLPLVPIQKRGASFYFIDVPQLSEEEYDEKRKLEKELIAEINNDNCDSKLVEYHDKGCLFGYYLNSKTKSLCTGMLPKYSENIIKLYPDEMLKYSKFTSDSVKEFCINDLLCNHVSVQNLISLIYMVGIEKCIEYGLNLNYLNNDCDILTHIGRGDINKTIADLNLLYENNYDFSDDANFYNLYDLCHNDHMIVEWLKDHNLKTEHSALYMEVKNLNLIGSVSEYMTNYYKYNLRNRLSVSQIAALIQLSKIPGISSRFVESINHSLIDPNNYVTI